MHHCPALENEMALRAENKNRAAIEYSIKALFTPATDGQHSSLYLVGKIPGQRCLS
jgi:hypothetical protein